jgi:hypothetical protein
MKISLLICAATLTVISGCATQRILSIQDHPTLPLTKVETMKTKSFLFASSAEHQFWLCKDEGESMSCDLECGGNNDLTCPQGILTGGTTTSNVQ